jgi:hypothetical protein
MEEGVRQSPAGGHRKYLLSLSADSGAKLYAWPAKAQEVEAALACRILNHMSELG